MERFRFATFVRDAAERLADRLEHTFDVLEFDGNSGQRRVVRDFVADALLAGLVNDDLEVCEDEVR